MPASLASTDERKGGEPGFQSTDSVGAKQTPPELRAPNGVSQDSRTYWLAGKPLYQPSDITVPNTLIYAEWDADLPTCQTAAYMMAQIAYAL